MDEDDARARISYWLSMKSEFILSPLYTFGEEVQIWKEENKTEEYHDAVKFVKRLPIEIECKILDLVTNHLRLSELSRIIDRRNIKHQRIFEKLCRDNNVITTYNNKTVWNLEYERFQRNLIEHLADEVQLDQEMDSDIGKEVASIILDSPEHKDWDTLPDYVPKSNRTVHCVLQRPKRERPCRARRTCLLQSNLDLSNFQRHLLLGNYHDVTVQQDEEMVCTHNTFHLTEESPLTCDEEDFAYYLERDEISTEIYQINLRVNKAVARRVTGHKFPAKVVGLAASGGKLFIMGIHPVLKYVSCYDIRNGEFLITFYVHPALERNPFIVGLSGMMAVAGKGFLYVYRGGCDRLLYHFAVPIRHMCMLSRHVLITVSDRDGGQVDVNLISIYDGKSHRRPLKTCDVQCVIHRHSDQFFSLLEPSRRTLWFHSAPEVAPLCIHVVRGNFNPVNARNSEGR